MKHGMAGKLISEANDAAVKNDMSHQLKSGHDKVIKDESGVLLVEEELVAAKWRQLLHGQEIKWSVLASIASAHEKQHAEGDG